MEVKVCKTFEIEEGLWKSLTEGFNDSFSRDVSEKYLKDYYSNTILGFSYHSLAIKDGKVIASNAVTPMPYNDNAKHIICGYNGGTFILRPYRNDISLLNRMLKVLEKECKKEEIAFILAVPNEKSLLYFERIAGYKKIDHLKYYILFNRISPFLSRKFSGFFDIISIAFSRILLFFNYILSYVFDFQEKNVRFALQHNDEFHEKRFFQKYYVRIKEGNFTCIYRIIDENHIKTAYLMDFRSGDRRSLRALVKASNKILRDESIDVILFIGHLRIKQFLFFKVPRQNEPQTLPLVYKILDESYNHLNDINNEAKNWNFSLMNFDVR